MMGSSQQFSLRWNNYLRHIRGAFDSLRTDEDLVDVTLCCEGRKIRAHKMLLSACSTYFRDLFKENPCQHPVIIFKDVKFVDLKALIDFIYQGEVNVVQDQLSSFLLTAELLAVQGLTDGTSKDVREISSNSSANAYDRSPQHPQNRSSADRSVSPPQTPPAVKKPRRSEDITSPASSVNTDTHSAVDCDNSVDKQCATDVSKQCAEALNLGGGSNQTESSVSGGVDRLTLSQQSVSGGQTLSQRSVSSVVDRLALPQQSNVDRHTLSQQSSVVDRHTLSQQSVSGVVGSPTMSQSGGSPGQKTDDEIRPADMIKVEMPDYLDEEDSDGCVENLSRRNSSGNYLPPGLPSSQDDHPGVNSFLDISRVMALCGPSSTLCPRELSQDLLPSLRLSDRFPCKYCDRTFNTLPILERHIAARHQLQDEMFFCSVCARYFKTKWSLSTHNSRYHKGKP